MAIEKIKIVKIGRKTLASKFKEGDTYTQITILAEDQRRIGSFDAEWTKDWKEGMTVEGDITKTVKKDRDGFDIVYWTIKNPYAKPKQAWTPKAGGSGNYTVVQSYQIAAAIAPLIYKNSKDVTFEEIVVLADKIKAKLGGTATAEQQKPVPEVNVDKEDKPAAPVKKLVDVDFPEEEVANDEIDAF